ncbi:hypothetical protein HDR66_03730 [bacterium]|nr:hypothetical protein [bacterium]
MKKFAENLFVYAPDTTDGRVRCKNIFDKIEPTCTAVKDCGYDVKYNGQTSLFGSNGDAVGCSFSYNITTATNNNRLP